MDELQTQHQLAVHPDGLLGADAQKTLNRLLVIAILRASSQCSIQFAMLSFLFPVLISLSAASAPAANAAPKFDRSEATSIIAGMRKIVVSDGIDRLEKVRIGGIDQWVSIRGNDPKNPVLLMLHGGPGWVSMPTNWYF